MNIAILTENELITTLLALSLLLFSAFIFGKIFEFFKAPKVVGEIVGGMLIGGSGLYHLCPNFFNSIFLAYDNEGKVLNIFYQLGLIFLMFSSGYNTNIEVEKENKKSLILLFSGATFIPMLLSIPFINLYQEHFIGNSGNTISFGIVFAIGIAITSIPVISKIFFDIGVMNTKFSNLVLTASTFQDLCLWILLNLSIQLSTKNEIQIKEMLLIVLLTIGIFIFVQIVGTKLKTLKNKFITTNLLPIIFIILLLTTALLSKLGINIMYSSFIVGYIIKLIIGTEKETKEKIDNITNFAFSFFVPIYFALVGIQLDVIHNFSLIRFITFFIIAFSLEAIGTILLLLLSKFNKKTIINLAIAMNARGGPGIVLATTAYTYQIINIEFFTVLILTTMLSSLLAGYWLRYVYKKDTNIFTNLYNDKNK